MKTSNYQQAIALISALISTSVWADNDTEKLQQQLDELQKEVDSMKSSKAFNLEFGGRLQLDYNHFDGAGLIVLVKMPVIFLCVALVYMLKVSTVIGIANCC